MQKRSSIHDVATTAGVSVSTVSNVLNRPHVVARDTRTKVLGAIELLRFQRNEQAASLRLGKVSRRPSRSVHTQVPEPECQPVPAEMAPVQAPALDMAGPAAERWQDISEGHPVLVCRFGQRIGSGLAEGSMPDGSGIWVRYDDGRGRRYLTKDDGYVVTPLPAKQPSVHI